MSRSFAARLAWGGRPSLPDPDTYLNRYAHCDVLICGAGPAGLAAALAASASGARVILADEQSEMGGSLLSEAAALSETTATINGKSAALWLSETLDTLRGRECIRLLPRTTAFGVFPDRLIGLVERNTDHLADITGRTSARNAVAGARQAGDRGGGRHRAAADLRRQRSPRHHAGRCRRAPICNRYGAAPGARVVVATACDSAYRAADGRCAPLASRCPVIADLRPSRSPLRPRRARQPASR